MENKVDLDESDISEPQVKDNVKGGFNMDKHFLPLSIVIAGVLISASILYVNLSKSSEVMNSNAKADLAAAMPNTVVKVDIDDDPILGSKDAPVVIIEFSDYQCPFCRVFWEETLPLLKKNYIDTGKVAFVYRDYPLSGHQAAQISAVAANCANEQGKYWEYHDKIFSEQAKLGKNTISYDKDDLAKWAKELGLNIPSFNLCFSSGKYDEEIKKDYAAGSVAGVTGTPGFFINGRPVKGALPYEFFESIIKEELDKK